MAGPPLRDGVVAIRGDRIAAVEPARGDWADGARLLSDARQLAQWPTDRDEPLALDLGDAILLPGLINCHTHLDLSGVEHPLGAPGTGMADWIRLVLAWRRQSPTAPRESIAAGLNEAARFGTTTLVDIAQPDAPLDTAAKAPLGVIPMLELIGPTPARAAVAVSGMPAFLATADGRGVRAGLAPHAPYSFHWQGLIEVTLTAKEQRLPVSFHLAESADEMRLFADRGGPLRGFLKEVGGYDGDTIPSGSRPLDYLGVLARAAQALVIHGNYLCEDDWRWLAEHRENMAVVYCPRTHGWFQHPSYPLAAMLAAGVRVVLGTDSRASAPDLDPRAEIRRAAELHPAVAPGEILAMATSAAAAALGRHNEIGALEVGKRADMVAYAAGAACRDPMAGVVYGKGRMLACWRTGRLVTGAQASD
jgi:cytosine/adenosine deaminase-related metal-dependent hydrolase